MTQKQVEELNKKAKICRELYGHTGEGSTFMIAPDGQMTIQLLKQDNEIIQKMIKILNWDHRDFAKKCDSCDPAIIPTVGFIQRWMIDNKLCEGNGQKELVEICNSGKLHKTLFDVLSTIAVNNGTNQLRIYASQMETAVDKITSTFEGGYETP